MQYSAAIQPQPHYTGHKSRLRKRFLAHDPSALPDYELIEMLLSVIQPRKDMKPLAKELLRIFESFTAVICAESAQLKAVEGIGESSIAMFKVIHEAICRILKQGIMDRPVINNISRVVDYCKASMAYRGTEQSRILFLNAKNYLISDEMRTNGTVCQVTVHAREVVKRALDLYASGMIMVHNHPTGDPSPSQQDIDLTREVCRISDGLSLTLHDHIIVAKNGYYSMKHNGDF